MKKALVLEEAVFAIGSVKEIVHEMEQIQQGQSCYDGGERWSDV